MNVVTRAGDRTVEEVCLIENRTIPCIKSGRKSYMIDLRPDLLII